MFNCFSGDQLQNVNDIRGSSDNKSGIEIVQGSMVQSPHQKPNIFLKIRCK